MVNRGLTKGGLLVGSLIFSLEIMAQPDATGEQLQPSAKVLMIQDAPKPEEPTGDTLSAEIPATDSTITYTDRDPVQATDSDSPSSIGPILPHDLSPWGMFMQADWVVKAVMIGLVLASIATWTVLFAKTRELGLLVKQQQQTLAIVTKADSLPAAQNQLMQQSKSELIAAASDEWQRSVQTLADNEGLKERVASSLERLEAARGRAITRGTSILATIGATAPFVGLFGTVWGIMNSFIGISKAQTTNLAVVAPGIAEALLATALGLIAAIPAVVIYNHFARKIAAYKALIGDTSAAILRLVSRDLSRLAVADPQIVRGET